MSILVIVLLAALGLAVGVLLTVLAFPYIVA